MYLTKVPVEPPKTGQADADQWRELATGMIRNLGRLIEDAQAVLKRAQLELSELEERENARTSE
jgi:hypothetical protein